MTAARSAERIDAGMLARSDHANDRQWSNLPLTASPSIFFLLVFILSVPFYLLGAVGGRLPGLPILRTSAVMTFAPMTGALILVYRHRGAEGVVALLKRLLAFGHLIGICAPSASKRPNSIRRVQVGMAKIQGLDERFNNRSDRQLRDGS